MRLFGLEEDELMPDLHIARDGVLRIRLGAHQEHKVNHVARATDRTNMKIKVDLTLPDMSSTIHEGTYNCSCSQEA